MRLGCDCAAPRKKGLGSFNFNLTRLVVPSLADPIVAAAANAAEAARVKSMTDLTGGAMPHVLFMGNAEPTEAQGWGGNMQYAQAAVGHPLAAQDGGIVYAPFGTSIFSGNANRPSYVYQDWQYPDWIAQQVAVGNIKAINYNGSGAIWAAPQVILDSKFAVIETGQWRGHHTGPNGLLQAVGTVAQIIAVVFPPAAPIAQPIASAIAIADAVKTGNILEGIGAALSLPGVPNLTLPGSANLVGGNAAITASNVVGAANVVVGAEKGNLLQLVGGAAALPGIDTMVSNALQSAKDAITGNTLPPAQQAPAPVTTATPTPVNTDVQTFAVTAPEQIDQLIANAAPLDNSGAGSVASLNPAIQEPVSDGPSVATTPNPGDVRLPATVPSLSDAAKYLAPIVGTATGALTLAQKLFSPAPSGSGFVSNLPPGTTAQQGVDSLSGLTLSNLKTPLFVILGAFLLSEVAR